MHCLSSIPYASQSTQSLTAPAVSELTRDGSNTSTWLLLAACSLSRGSRCMPTLDVRAMSTKQAKELQLSLHLQCFGTLVPAVPTSAQEKHDVLNVATSHKLVLLPCFRIHHPHLPLSATPLPPARPKSLQIQVFSHLCSTLITTGHGSTCCIGTCCKAASAAAQLLTKQAMCCCRQWQLS